MNPYFVCGDRIASSTSRALAWVFQHRDRFSLFDERDTYRPDRMKPFIELAIMLGVRAATGDIASPLARKATRLFESASRRPDFTHWIFRRPAEIVNYAELCSALTELGGDARELRETLQHAVDMGVLSQIERLPHRDVELAAALDWAGVRHSLPSLGDLCAETILGQPFSASLLDNSAIYAITHVIIFACRFGLLRNALPAWLGSTTISTLLSDLIVVTSQEGNWDMLGELLLCWDSIGFEHSRVTGAGWELFLDVFRADGAVPPAATGVKEDTSPHSEEQTTKDTSDFDRVYHTTLVAALAGTVFLSRSGPPSQPAPNGTKKRSEVNVSEVNLV